MASPTRTCGLWRAIAGALVLVAVLVYAAPAAAQNPIVVSKIYMGTATITSSGTSIVLSGLTVTGTSSLGTVSAGTWQGSAIGTGYGGTGLTSWTAGDVPYYASGAALSKLGIGASGRWFGSSGSAPQWNAPAALTKTDDTNVTLALGGSASTALLNAASLTLGWTGQLAVGRGGTGAATFTDGGLLVGNSTSAVQAMSAGSAGQIVRSGGAGIDPSWSTATYPGTATGTGTILRADGTNWVATTATYPTTVAAGDLLHASSANVIGGLSIGSSGKMLRSTGSLPAWSTPTWPNAAASASYLRGDGTNWIESTLKLPNSAAAGDVFIGSSSNTMGSLAISATGGTFLRSTGSAPQWSTLVLPNAATTGDLLYASATNTIAALADVSVGSYLRSGGVGTAPLWSTLKLPNALTQYRMLYGSAADTASQTTNLTWNESTLAVTGSETVTGWLKHPSYASQTSYWGIDGANGAADFRYLFVDEMHAKSFIADLEQALAGGQIISKSVAVVHADVILPVAGASVAIVFRDLPSATGMGVFVNGDWVALRQFARAGGSLTIGWAWGTVVLDTTYGVSGFDAATKTQRWTFTRSSTYPGLASGTIYADAVALDFGTDGNGYYEVNAIDGARAVNSPYAQVVTWSDGAGTGGPGTPNALTVRSRFGNLRGITATDNEFGLLAGTFAATDGAYFRASNTAFELHGIDVSMWDGSVMAMALRRNSGAPYLGIGNDAGSGAPTSFASNVGFWVGEDSSVYKLRVGNPAGVRFAWDGTDLKLGDQNNEYAAFNATGFQLFTGATNYAELDGSVFRLGATGANNENIVISPADGIRFRTNTDVLAQLTGTTWTLGAAATNNVTVTSSAIALNNATTPYATLTAGSLVLGAAADTQITLDTTDGFKLIGEDDATRAQLSATGVLTLGRVATDVENILIDPTAGIQFRGGTSGTAVLGTLNSSQWTLGNPTRITLNADGSGSLASGNIAWTTAGVLSVGGWTINAADITATGAKFASGASPYLSFGATPPTTYGNNVGAWLGYSSGAKLSLYADASNYFQWDGSKALIKAANFTLDASGNLTASNATLSGTLSAASGAVTVNASGVQVATTDCGVAGCGSTDYAALNAYKFTPLAYVAGDQFGLYAKSESQGARYRYLGLRNIVTHADAYAQSIWETRNSGGVTASIALTSTATNAGNSSTIIINSAGGTTFSTGGVAVSAGGIALSDSTPSSTTARLYNASGNLYWGSTLIASGSALTGIYSSAGLTSGRVPYATAAATIETDAGLTYNATTDTLTAGTFSGSSATFSSLVSLNRAMSASAYALYVAPTSAVANGLVALIGASGVTNGFTVTMNAAGTDPVYTFANGTGGTSTTYVSGLLTVVGTSGFTGRLTAAGGVAITGGSSTAGSLYKEATWGLIARGVTGTSADLSLVNNAGDVAAYVPPGTQAFIIVGAASATSMTAGEINASATVPYFMWTETDGGTNEKRWDFYANGGSLYLRTVNDAYDSASQILYVTRSGQTPTGLHIPNTHITIGGGGVGRGLLGTYDSTKYRAIYSMGTGYVMASDGSALDTLYGLYYGYDNTGVSYKNVTGYSLGHGFGLAQNGSTKAYFGGDGMWRSSEYGLIHEHSTTSGSTLVAKVTGDSYGRFVMSNAGSMEWGDGTSARDTNLYRSAANTLKTDDALLVASTLGVTGTTTLASGTYPVTIAGSGLGVGANISAATTLHLGTTTANSVAIYTGGTARLTLDGSTGNATFSGSVRATGADSAMSLAPTSHDAIVSAIGASGYHGTLFLSAAGSGKDTHIVYGGGRTLNFSYSASATAVATGTAALSLGATGNAVFSGAITGEGSRFGASNTGSIRAIESDATGTDPSTITTHRGVRTQWGSGYGVSMEAWYGTHPTAGFLIWSAGTDSRWIDRSYASTLTNLTGELAVSSDLEVSGGDLTSTTNLNITPTGNLTLNPTGDIYVNPTGNDVLPTTTYDINLGSLAKKFLTLHAAELWVETLVAQDTIATIGGRILVGPTTMLTADLAAAATTITVKHNEMASGDRVYLEANGKVEFLAITSAPGGSAGAYTYSVTRNLDGSGANDWYAGDAIFNTGTTGEGFMDLYSVRGVKAATEYGPTIAGNERQSTTYNDWETRWAIGNLNGVYGYSATAYGAGFGDPSATNLVVDATNGVRFRNGATVLGQLSSSAWTLGNTASEHVAISGTSVQIKDGATVFTDLTGGTLTLGDTSVGNVLVTSTAMQVRSGSTVHTSIGAASILLGEYVAGKSNVYITDGNLSLRSGATTRIRLTGDGSGYLANSSISWDTSGNLTVAANATIGGWAITSADMKAQSGTVGMSSGASYSFWAGDATPASAEFSVTPAGAIKATSGAIGGWTLGATSLVAGSAGTTVGLDSGGSNPAIYAGSATPASAPFRVTNAGAVTATSGVIGGFTLASNLLSSGTDADYVAMSSGGTNAFWAGDSTFADAEFSVTAAGALKATNATITSASSIISIGSTGVEITTPGTSFSDTYAYKFKPSASITGTAWGLYTKEPDSTQRYMALRNETATSGKLAWTQITNKTIQGVSTELGSTISMFANGTLGTNYVDITSTSITLTGATSVTGALSSTSTITASSGFVSGSSSGLTRTCNPTAGNMTFTGGILTGCTAVEPEPDTLASAASLPTQVAALRAEVDQLRAIVAQLLGRQ